MPPNKTSEITATTTNKGAQATGKGNLHIVELPPLPTPGSMSSQVDSDEALPADLAAAINLLAKSLSSLKKSSAWTKVHKLDVFDGSDTHKSNLFWFNALLTSVTVLMHLLLTVLKLPLHCPT